MNNYLHLYRPNDDLSSKEATMVLIKHVFCLYILCSVYQDGWAKTDILKLVKVKSLTDAHIIV